jgi:hypothetical protein
VCGLAARATVRDDGVTDVTTGMAADNRHSGGTRGSRGTPLVVALVTLAIGLALFAIWFQWRQTRRCLEFYGTETARLIQRATRVEVWERSSAGGATAGPGPHEPVIDRYDVSTARGLVHLRRGLVEDANLDWSRLDDRAVPPPWNLALAFFEPAGATSPAALLLFERPDDASTGGAFLAVDGRPGRVGLGRLAGGIERWWRSVRDDAVPTVGGGGTAP